MSYRPIPTSTVYSAKFFRRTEVQDAFEKVEQIKDTFWREASRNALISLVSVASEIGQQLDDLDVEIKALRHTLDGINGKLDRLLEDR